VESEVLTVVVMKSSFFWYITPCSPLKVSWHFGGTYHLHLQGWRIHQETSMKAGGRQSWFLVSLILRPWIWKRHVPPKHRLTFNRLYSIISQKIELFSSRASLRNTVVLGTLTLDSVHIKSFKECAIPHEKTLNFNHIIPIISRLYSF
jgi:hypothetical protein